MRHKKNIKISSLEKRTHILRDIFPKILKVIVFLSFSLYSHAQSSSDIILPSYKGGTNRLWYDYNEWIRGIDWPKEGEIEVAFVVSEDGSIKNARIIKGLSDDDNNEVLNILKYSSRKWYPAFDHSRLISKEVRMSFTFKQNRIVISDVMDYSMQNNNSEMINSKNDWQQLPNHKTYEGEFAAFNLHKQSGKAKYQYIEKEGRQIFDGRFVFVSKQFKAEGMFSNDFQVGRWEFTQGGLKTVINFDREGNPNGDYFIYLMYISSGNLIFDPYSVSFGYMSNGKFETISSLTNKGYIVTSDYTLNQKLYSRKVEGRTDIKWNYYNGFYILDNNGDESRIDVGQSYSDIYKAIMDINRYLLRSTKSIPLIGEEYYKIH